MPFESSADTCLPNIKDWLSGKCKFEISQLFQQFFTSPGSQHPVAAWHSQRCVPGVSVKTSCSAAQHERLELSLPAHAQLKSFRLAPWVPLAEPLQPAQSLNEIQQELPRAGRNREWTQSLCVSLCLLHGVARARCVRSVPSCQFAEPRTAAEGAAQMPPFPFLLLRPWLVYLVARD